MRRIVFVLAAGLLLVSSTALASSSETKRYIAAPEFTGIGCALEPGVGNVCFEVPASSKGKKVQVSITDDRATHVEGSYLIECVDENGRGPICPGGVDAGTGEFCDAGEITLPEEAVVLHIHLQHPLGPSDCVGDATNVPTTGTITVTWAGG